jgi:hypothetical protein
MCVCVCIYIYIYILYTHTHTHTHAYVSYRGARARAYLYTRTHTPCHTCIYAYTHKKLGALEMSAPRNLGRDRIENLAVGDFSNVARYKPPVQIWPLQRNMFGKWSNFWPGLPSWFSWSAHFECPQLWIHTHTHTNTHIYINTCICVLPRCSSSWTIRVPASELRSSADIVVWICIYVL